MLATLKKFRLSLSDFGVSSQEDVDGIKKAQRLLGVDADGSIGPKTCYAYYMAKRNTIDIRDSISFNRTQYKFSNVMKRTKLASIVVIHDTIAPTVKSTYNSLQGHKPNKFSTNYMIDYDGTIHESCNPVTHYTVHAGALNDESIGIDMVNALDPKFLDRESYNLFDADKRVRKAPWSASVVKPGFAIDYTTSQKRALVRLCDYLSDILNIPKIVPSMLTGYGEKVPGFTEDFLGFCAHGQWSTKRWDGLFGVEHLMSEGYKGVSLE